MTALDNDMAAMRATLIARFHDQPAIRAALDMAAITAAVDVAMAGAGLRDVVAAAAAGAEAVTLLVDAVGDDPPADVAEALEAFDTRKGFAQTHYPSAIP